VHVATYFRPCIGLFIKLDSRGWHCGPLQQFQNIMRHVFFFFQAIQKWKLPSPLSAMVNRRISADIKDCVLRLWAAGWNEEDVLSALSVSRASLYRWKAYFDTFGMVNKLPSPLKGRTRIVTRAVLTAVYQIYETNSDIYLDELVWWLAINHDIVISRSALQQNLQEAGLTRKLLRKLALERDAALRLEWKEFILEHGEGQAQEFVVGCVIMTSIYAVILVRCSRLPSSSLSGSVDPSSKEAAFCFFRCSFDSWAFRFFSMVVVLVGGTKTNCCSVEKE
jgi:transposase